MDARREKFVSTKQFLDSARNLGVTVEEGVYEVLDNSFDAEAENIWVKIDKKENGNLQFIFTDDGIGIPREHIDEDGESHQGIPYVLAYGGRIPNPFRPEPIGKFGFGLSQTASCLSARTEVYTKTADDEKWRFSYYDFNELEKEDCLLPEESFRQPPWIELPETGTIVVMQEVDQADYAQPNAIVNMLLGNLGRVYRFFLANDCTIRISEGNKQERSVRINDPLCEMEDSLEVQALGTSLDYGEETIVFDGNNPLGEIIDPRTEEPAEIRIRFRRLSVETVRTALDIPLTGVSGAAGAGPSKITQSPLSKWGIGYNGQGFSVLRNGREIRNSETLRLYTKNSAYNYFRAHVAFSDALDELFNVQTNKSRITITKELRELLDERCSKHIEKIAADHRAEVRRLKRTAKVDVIPVAEIVAADVGHMLTKPRISDKEREQGEAAVEQKVATLIQEAKQDSKAIVDNAKTALETAQKSNDEAAIVAAESEVKLAEEQSAVRIKTLEKRFAFESNCRRFTDVVGSGGLFNIEHHGDHVWVTVNTATEFYDRVYRIAEKDPELEGLLDVMLFSIAWSEHVDAQDDEMKVNWEHIRREISAQAEIFVSSMAPLIDEDAEGGEA